MKYLLPAIIAICCPIIVFCQDITGLWTGTLHNDATKETLRYEIFVSKSKGKYSGYSQTWLSVNDKQYYGIKKMNIRIAKDGKVVMQDVATIETNLPDGADKNVIQLNVLDLVNQGTGTNLAGFFVTNRSRIYRELTGQISLKRVSATNENSLVKYALKNSNEDDVTALK